jgi:hypothetical protein
MASYLMYNVWFGSILGVLHVSKVLGRAEELKCKSIKKLSLAQDAMSGLNSKPSATMQIGRKFL